jgi:hypothetical protein
MELLKSTAFVVAVPVFVAGYLAVWTLGQKPLDPPVIEQPIEEKPAMVDAAVTVEPASVGQEIMVQP